ncbi:succinylglutamate desuccinylase [Reinekea blandensis]|uniref:Succinylglutamate desuccinylase n=1 Tax=Reinekea blandensis MED297 TaxID=314283 RepID=A4BK50_9GAMM|nr:succinylglutamate desuccinylase [Reinekea blandensis]EAR07479.1 succinylglutamate desuccinylase [Reinekea sp. MED297] [Reinekea blandensis MED297]
MTAFFFSPHKNIIRHTLATRDDEVAPRHEILSAGTEVTLLDNGIIRFEPNTASDTSLVISCAVHGNETAPIEIVSAIIDDLLAEDQKCGQRVLFILGNPWAMEAGTRFVDVNMNRLFCGDWQHQDLTLPEVKRAAKLEAYVANFFAEEPVTATQRLHYDCHTAIRDSARERFAVYPFVAGRTLPETQKAFLDSADVHTVLLQQQAANTFSSFTSLQQNAESFTLELGKVRPFGENDLTRFEGIDRTLRRLIAGDALPDSPINPVDGFTVHHTIEKTSEHWEFFVEDDVANFTEFAPGTEIWRDGDDAYIVGDEPEYIVFPNRDIPVGQRAGLMLRKQSG